MSDNEKTTLEKDGARIEGEPHLWIQWKGTDVCCDIHCKCGADLHFDGYFLYNFQCGECGQLYETGSHVLIYPVDSVDGPVSPPVLKTSD